MALSSGTRSLLGEAASWLIAGAVMAGGLVYFNELRGLTGEALGLATTTGQKPALVEAHAQPNERARTSGAVEIRAGASGHFQAEAEVNGRTIGVMVDTGATMVALTYEDAERAGIRLKPSDFTRSVTTANGVTRVAPVTLERVSIGDITVRNVAASVSERGRLSTTLLGMSFLSRLERVDMRSGILVLKD
jgi:aspartyl protease family protein